jgi:hypothetical protein
MKKIARVMLPAALALLQVPAPAVRAEQPAGSLLLHLTLSRRPPAAQPVPDPKIAEKDAEQAMAEIQARERRDELIRELTQGRFLRPDLDRDLISGIQSRNLTDALRRR